MPMLVPLQARQRTSSHVEARQDFLNVNGDFTLDSLHRVIACLKFHA